MSPFWILLELRMMEVVVTTGDTRHAKFQSNHHHQQTNTQLLTGRMPFLSPNQHCQSTEGKCVCVCAVCVKAKPNSNSFFSHDPQRSRARCANYCLLGQLSFLLSVGWEISSEGLLWLTGALIPLLAAIWFQSLKLACATSQTSNCY